MTKNEEDDSFLHRTFFDESPATRQRTTPLIPSYASLLSLVFYLFLEVRDKGDRTEDISILFSPEYDPDTLLRRAEPRSFEVLMDALKEDTSSFEFYTKALNAIQNREIEAYQNEYDRPLLDLKELPENQNVYTISFLIWAEQQGQKISELVLQETKELMDYYVSHKQRQRVERENFPELSGDEFAKLASEPLWTVANAILYTLGYQSDATGSMIQGFISKRKVTKRIIEYIKDAASIGDLVLVGDFDSDDDFLFKTKLKPKDFIRWIVELPLKLPISRLANLGSASPQTPLTYSSESEKPNEYTPPYIVFMLHAAKSLEISPDKTTVKKQIEHWLKENWPYELGEPTDNLIKYMATLIRRPEEQKGGNRPNEKKPQS